MVVSAKEQRATWLAIVEDSRLPEKFRDAYARFTTQTVAELRGENTKLRLQIMDLRARLGDNRVEPL